MNNHNLYLPEDYPEPALVEQLVDKEGMSYSDAWQIADPDHRQHLTGHAPQVSSLHRTGNVRDFTSDSGSDPYWNGGIQPTDEERRNAASPMSRGRVLAREMAAVITAGDDETRQKLLEILSDAPEQGGKPEDDKVA